MNPLVIGGLIKRVYPKFDIDEFEYRLKLQKFVYLFQQFTGMYLGYNFNWYHFGPYCPELTNDAFAMPKIEKIDEVKFSEETQEKKFIEFISIFEKYKNDPKRLEIISSLYFLKRIYPKATDMQIIEKVRTKRKEFENKKNLIEDLFKLVEEKKL